MKHTREYWIVKANVKYALQLFGIGAVILFMIAAWTYYSVMFALLAIAMLLILHITRG